METGTRFRVLADYEVHDPHPLRLGHDQPVKIIRSDLGWPGWVWVEAQEQAGWIPESYLTGLDSDRPCTSRTFDGSDLSARRGEILTLREEAPGWIFGQRKDGTCGWFPLFNLRPHRHT